MTPEQFAPIMAYLEGAIGKRIAPETAAVYWDLLGDLPADALATACRVVLLESTYPTLPTAGRLRQAVLATQRPSLELPAPEAWNLLRSAVRMYGYYRESLALSSLPALVRRAAECLGWRAICDCTETEILRAQFTRAYESLAERAKREALLPPQLAAVVRQIGRAEPPQLEGK